MTKRTKTSRKGAVRQRRIAVRGIRRSEPDIRKLSQALISLALAQAEADAQAQQRNNRRGEQRPGGDTGGHEDTDVA